MKKFLTLERTNSIILLAIIFFAVSLFTHHTFRFDLFLYISGFLLALYIPGLSILNIFDRNNYWLEKLIISPVFTIFIFLPLYYIFTLFLGGKINFLIAAISIFVIALFSLIATFRKTEIHEKSETRVDNKFIYFGIGAFILVHILTTLAYRFIPEVDGYTDLMSIENIISSGIFNVSYRPLFQFLLSYVSLISQIPPYWLFKFGMIIIQISGIYYLYQIIKIAGIKSSFAKYLILLSFVAVPIINLEIDYVRPNIIFIFALLPFIYYLSKGLDGLKINFIFSSIIATAGLLFHEFFGILFLINLFFITSYFYKKFSSLKKMTFVLISAVLLLIVLINIEKFPMLMLPINSVDKLLTMISSGLHWNWWFLDNYLDMGGNNLGWTGFWDVSKYYAYSLSPFLVLIFFGFIFTIIAQIKQNEKLFSIEKVALAILFVGLVFSEFLPRIDFKTLPDRFWPMLSVSLLALTPFVFLKIRFFEKKTVSGIILILLLIGIGGSIYIAKAKRGYTSEKEYAAAQWIKNNTPENSLFITQGGNGVMLGYFANRKAISPFASFFLNKDKQTSRIEILKSTVIYKNAIDLFNESLLDPSDDNLSDLNNNLKSYHEEMEREKLAKNIESPEFKLPSNENMYVLYSFDKFNSCYGQRQWWREANFYDADLDKFKDGYELVYNDNDIIYIWKKKRCVE